MTAGLLDTSVVINWHDPVVVAATAHANRLDLYTRKADDFTGFDGLVRIIAI